MEILLCVLFGVALLAIMAIGYIAERRRAKHYSEYVERKEFEHRTFKGGK